MITGRNTIPIIWTRTMMTSTVIHTIMALAMVKMRRMKMTGGRDNYRVTHLGTNFA